MILRLYKRTEKSNNKIRLPKKFVDKYGRDYYMEVYEDKIILIPVNKEV